MQWTNDICNSDDDNDNNEGDNNLQLSNEVEYHMKNYPDQAWIDNTLQDLHYSSQESYEGRLIFILNYCTM